MDLLYIAAMVAIMAILGFAVTRPSRDAESDKKAPRFKKA